MFSQAIKFFANDVISKLPSWQISKLAPLIHMVKHLAGSWLLLTLLTLFSLPALASYTKIANSGSQLPDSAQLGSGSADWACTRDNATGLIWEVKTASAGLRYGGNLYTNYDDPTKDQKQVTISGQVGFVHPTQAEIDAASNSIGFVTAVNATALCGSSNWRRPSLAEQLSLYEASHSWPTPNINQTYFPNTSYFSYWTGTPYFDPENYGWESYAWNVVFGNESHTPARFNVEYLRLVLGLGNAGIPMLSVAGKGSGSGTITSDPTGINCGSSCITGFNIDTSVTLTATPVGSFFAGWSGDCSGTNTSCTVTMNAEKMVAAAFTSPPEPWPPTPNDQWGVTPDNEYTDFDTGGPGDDTGDPGKPPGKPPGKAQSQCPGLPMYGVNTSYLNLSVEDTDFAWKSFGHDLALRRVWNMQPGLSGMFGNGWSFAYESTLRTMGSLATGAATTVKLGSGQQYSYTVSASQSHHGTVTLNHAYSSEAVKPILTGYISEATGNGYYTFVDKSSKLTNRYDYFSTDAATGEKIYRLTRITDRNGNELTLAYDSSARLSTLTDASNRVTTFSYNASNRVTQISTINNKAATFEYDASGNLIRNVDLAGNIITYTYDANKLMTSMTAEGKTTGFTYFTDADNNKHVSSLTDAMGNVTHYEFWPGGGTKVTEPGGGIRSYTQSSGRTTSVTDQLHHTAGTAFNSNWLPASSTDIQGRITSYLYDANGNLTSLTDPAGKITTFEYDANWNLTKTTDPLGNIWRYTYNASNNLTGATSPLGLTTTYTVNNKGLVTQVTRPDGSSVASTYNSNGNLTALTNPLNKTATFGFDAYGLELVSTTDPRANTTAFSYDPNRLLTSKTFPDSSNIHYSYACNALTSVTDGGGNTSTLQRDNLLHVTKITNPLGKFSSSVYNSDGFNTSTTDPLGRTTAIGYDAAHRMNSITNPLGKTILFSRNADGSPSSLTNELGKATTMAYDNRGLLLSITDPLGNATKTNSYDSLGRLSSVTSARGKTVSSLFDSDGRATEKKHDGVTVATYGWNSANQLASVTDSTGVKTFTRDAAGQVTAINYPDGLGLAIAYDDAGNVSSISYPGGLVVSYSYDSRNRTSGVNFGVSSVAFSYNSTGRLAAETRSNSVQSTYGYDAAGQLTSLSHKKGTTVIADLAYSRDGAGLVTGESGTLPLNPIIPSSSATGTYNNADGVLTWGGDNYTYDADGNLTAITGARTFSAVYDNQNRPTSITLGGTTTTYVYDDLGNRVKVQTTTATRNFHHDPWGRLLFETNASGLVTANYIYAGSRLIASGTTAAGYVFYHQDKTGNTLALTNASGAVAAAYAYSPYGAVLNKSGTATTPFTYVGAYGVMSEGSNLYFMKNRYYDAVTGRFIQRDPIGFAGRQSNLYAYVGNNPVNHTDPEGLRGGRELLAARADASREEKQRAQENAAWLGSSVAIGNLTAGIFFVSTTIGELYLAPQLTAGAIALGAVGVIVAAVRGASVLHNPEKYNKPGYTCGNAARDVADPTEFITGIYERWELEDEYIENGVINN